MTILRHASLGGIRGVEIASGLVQYRSLPYAYTKQRFARATILDRLPNQDDQSVYDATKVGPSSVQPRDAAKMDADLNQVPADITTEDQEQSEDCLRVTITAPIAHQPGLRNGTDKLPVLVFLHGGAFFLNSGERPYYSPVNLVLQALSESEPIIFVSINYRLGALGFFNSSQAPDLIPANNGLHDQVTAFQWIQRHISGFGGDPNNITAIGQSAGAESLSLHNISGQTTPLYKRSITFAGTPVTMPAKTPSGHEENFREKAQKLGIAVTNPRSSADIANDMIYRTSIEKFRDLGFVGAPCTSSEILPYDKSTMELSASGPDTTVDWLESQVVSAAGYDGSISWIITKKNPERRGHAESFSKIAVEVLGSELAGDLCELYGIDKSAGEEQDDHTLTDICQFASDIGFIHAAEAVAMGSTKKGVKTCLQLFDLPNPFHGHLEPGKFSTHSWDIVALLGAYDDRLTESFLRIVREWRRKLIQYCITGELPWPAYGEGKGLFVGTEGAAERDVETFPGSERRRKLGEIAKAAKGDSGYDLLWEGVCRRWLDRGQ